MGFFRDKWESIKLNAQYERTIQQRLVEHLNEKKSTNITEDPGDWKALGNLKGNSVENQQGTLREQVRQLVRENTYARNILRLLESYVVGEGLHLTFHAEKENSTEVDIEVIQLVDQLWKEFLKTNRMHFSFQEYARRVWRDGECFLRIYSGKQWPPQVRFIDPEWIGPCDQFPDSQGIETEAGDVESPRFYLKVNPGSGELIERIPAEEMIHSRIGVDSNEKRGVSFFAPLVSGLEQYEQWQETELQARKLQSSIVLWRKVQGSPSQAQSVADSAQTGSVQNRAQERVRPGTILTTSAGTDIQFLQPDTNFGDAVPLGRMLLLGIAAGAGIPEFMLTSDASNGNYSSTMVAEGPAVKMFQGEQNYFCKEFEHLWEIIFQAALSYREIESETLKQVRKQWSKPELISRDRPRERQADVALVNAKVLSRASVQRKENLDPIQVQKEIESEMDLTSPPKG